MKKVMKVLWGIFAILIPVASAVWLFSKGYEWWLSGLAALGVLLLLAFFYTFLSILAASFSDAWRNRKKR